jgi:hypothetical protein
MKTKRHRIILLQLLWTVFLTGSTQVRSCDLQKFFNPSQPNLQSDLVLDPNGNPTDPGSNPNTNGLSSIPLGSLDPVTVTVSPESYSQNLTVFDPSSLVDASFLTVPELIAMDANPNASTSLGQLSRSMTFTMNLLSGSSQIRHLRQYGVSRNAVIVDPNNIISPPLVVPVVVVPYVVVKKRIEATQYHITKLSHGYYVIYGGQYPSGAFSAHITIINAANGMVPQVSTVVNAPNSQGLVVKKSNPVFPQYASAYATGIDENFILVGRKSVGTNSYTAGTIDAIYAFNPLSGMRKTVTVPTTSAPNNARRNILCAAGQAFWDPVPPATNYCPDIELPPEPTPVPSAGSGGPITGPALTCSSGGILQFVSAGSHNPNFGTLTFSQTSPNKTFNFKNSGDCRITDLTFGNFASGGLKFAYHPSSGDCVDLASDYTPADPINGGIAVNDECSLKFKVITDTAGNYTSPVTINYDDGVNPFHSYTSDWNLTATVANGATLTGDSTFNQISIRQIPATHSPTQIYTFTSIGGPNKLRITDIIIPENFDTLQAGTDCNSNFNLVNSSTCTIAVKPKQEAASPIGVVTGSLQIKYRDIANPNQSPVTASIALTAVNAGELTYTGTAASGQVDPDPDDLCPGSTPNYVLPDFSFRTNVPSVITAPSAGSIQYNITSIIPTDGNAALWRIYKPSSPEQSNDDCNNSGCIPYVGTPANVSTTQSILGAGQSFELRGCKDHYLPPAGASHVYFTVKYNAKLTVGAEVYTSNLAERFIRIYEP